MSKLQQVLNEKAEVIRREKAAYESLDQMFEQLPAELLGTSPRVANTRATSASLRMWLLLTCSISTPASAQT